MHAIGESKNLLVNDYQLVKRKSVDFGIEKM